MEVKLALKARQRRKVYIEWKGKGDRWSPHETLGTQGLATLEMKWSMK
ncbi:hypothetical protein A2U01_0047412, partial [Trifolium medium]|nr:hypothetical protein [Trifolium medium]